MSTHPIKIGEFSFLCCCSPLLIKTHLIMIGSPSRSTQDPLPYLSPDASNSKPKTNQTMWGSPLRRSTTFCSETTNLYVSRSRHSSNDGGIQWNWIVLIYVCAFISTMTAKLCVNLDDSFDALERQSLFASAQRDHMRDDLNALDGYILEEQRKFRQLKKTRKALEHEVKVVAEYHEETGKSQFLPRQTDDTLPLDRTTTTSSSTTKKHSQTIQKWLSGRKENLVRRIHHLQNYLQRMSYAAVVRKFGGPGTYQVELTVDMKLDTGKRSVETITIETVPLEDMPVSIYLFLDTIRSGLIWNNAMLVRRATDMDHVLPVAPVDYDSHLVRRTILGTLGWIDVSFSCTHYCQTMFISCNTTKSWDFLNTIPNIRTPNTR
jgi:hypothetical protein